MIEQLLAMKVAEMEAGTGTAAADAELLKRGGAAMTPAMRAIVVYVRKNQNPIPTKPHTPTPSPSKPAPAPALHTAIGAWGSPAGPWPGTLNSKPQGIDLAGPP